MVVLAHSRAVEKRGLAEQFVHILSSKDTGIQILCLLALTRLLTVERYKIRLVDSSKVLCAVYVCAYVYVCSLLMRCVCDCVCVCLCVCDQISTLFTLSYSSSVVVQTHVTTCLCEIVRAPRPVLMKIVNRILPAMCRLALSAHKSVQVPIALSSVSVLFFNNNS